MSKQVFPNRTWTRGAAVLLVALAGCAHTHAEGSTVASTSARGGGPAMVASDARLAAVLEASNEALIRQSELAMQRGSHWQVRQFADQLVAQQRRASEHRNAWLWENDAHLVPSDRSYRLTMERREVTEWLDGQRGDDFDRSYLFAQVRQYEQMLQLLDSELIPNAQDPAFRSALESSRTMLSAHLEQARQLQTLVASR